MAVSTDCRYSQAKVEQTQQTGIVLYSAQGALVWLKPELFLAALLPALRPVPFQRYALADAVSCLRVAYRCTGGACCRLPTLYGQGAWIDATDRDRRSPESLLCGLCAPLCEPCVKKTISKRCLALQVSPQMLPPSWRCHHRDPPYASERPAQVIAKQQQYRFRMCRLFARKAPL
jgi:hypothetical protein